MPSVPSPTSPNHLLGDRRHEGTRSELQPPCSHPPRHGPQGQVGLGVLPNRLPSLSKIPWHHSHPHRRRGLQTMSRWRRPQPILPWRSLPLLPEPALALSLAARRGSPQALAPCPLSKGHPGPLTKPLLSDPRSRSRGRRGKTGGEWAGGEAEKGQQCFIRNTCHVFYLTSCDTPVGHVSAMHHGSR